MQLGEDSEDTLYQCPVSVISYDSMKWIRRYRHYANGFLMTGNGTEGNPKRYLEAMEIIDIEVKRRTK